MTAAYRFGPFELRPSDRTLLRDAQPQRLGGRAFDLLVVLVERRDRVVPKGELMDLVWPRLVVEENNLQVQVLALRKLLGPQAIATVPGRGYRFTLPLETSPLQPATESVADADADGAGTAPAALAPLIGRESDLRELDAALREHRLVTLLGAGGVGKSTLARHAAPAAAGRFADGAVWVDLTAVIGDAGVVDAVAAATRCTLGRGNRIKALAATLAPLKLLLVLDNAEHVLDGLLAVVNALHAAAAGVHLLVTSQAPLRLVAEQLYRLEPLALADPEAGLADAAASAAVQLFVARVRGSDRHFVLNQHNLAAVVSLTRRLDGLPLAIEMAAARVPALSPAQLDAALHERFRLLTRGERGAPARQHTLAAAMSWTHDLLNATERAVFRRLSVFVGSFSLPAAQAVCRDDDATASGSSHIDPWQVLDALAVLLDRSLVAPPVGEPPRYRLLDTPHAFALQCLAAASEEAATQVRHRTYFQAFFQAAYEDHLWVRQPVPDWLHRVVPDADNGLAAFAQAIAGSPDAAVALAPGLAQALVKRHAERFSVWHRTEPLLHDELPAPVRARWQLGFAQFWGVNSLQRSRPHATAAAALFLAEGHAAGEYRAQAILATSLGQQEDLRTKESLLRMLQLERPAWPADLRFLRRWAEATQLVNAERYEEALEAGHACMDLIRESGRNGRLVHEMGVVYLQIMAGRLDEAIARGLDAVQRLRQQQRNAPASGVEVLLMVAWLLKGDTAPARAIGPAVWEAGHVFNHKAAVADTLSLLAAREGRFRAAALLAGYAATDYARGATGRLAAFQRCGDMAESLLAPHLQPTLRAALRERGSHWPDEGIAALAFATRDVDDDLAADQAARA